MAEQRIEIDATKQVSVRIEFEGEARYTALLWERDPTNAARWRVARVLEERGNSWDARDDAFTFEPPRAGGELLLYIDANVTHAVVGSDVRVSADVFQGNQKLGTATESGKITTGFIHLVARALLVGK